MAGPADASGRAIYLDFPSTQGQRSQVVQQRGTGAGPGRPSGQQGGMGELQAPEGIQFDQAGIYESIYQAYGDLRNFLVSSRSKGIDPTKGPDPSRPESYAIVNQWNQATAQYMKLLHRSQQGLENMNYLMEAVGSGELTAGSEILDGGTGVLSQEEVMRNSIVNDPSWLREDIELLGTDPNSKEDYDDMIQYRNGRIKQMQEMVSSGSMTDQQFQYYLSKLPKPRRYDSLSDDLTSAKIATEDARRRSANRSNRGSAQPGRLQIKVEEMATVMNSIRNGKDISLADLKSVSGGLRGDSNVPLTGARGVNGDLELTFTAPVGLSDQAKVDNLISEKRREAQMYPERAAEIDQEIEQFQANTSSLPIRLYVSEENITGGLAFLMTNSEFRDMEEDLRKQGYSAGMESLDGTLKFFGFDEEENGQQATSSPALAVPRTSPAPSPRGSSSRRTGSTPGL